MPPKIFPCPPSTLLLHICSSSSQKNQKKENSETKTNTEDNAIMETFYISHGSPTLAIDDSLLARHFLEHWREKIFPKKPNSILVISGHWETDEPTVNSVQRCDTIYDFNGFPKTLYQLKYPAPGAPDLAKRVKELLKASGFMTVQVDKKRGLDHGTWVPLMLMYPEADIPVCQLSIQTHGDGTYHYNMRRALAPLKAEGVLIIGSGAATHNLGSLQHGNDVTVPPWAAEFDKWLEEALLSGRYDDVNHYEKKDLMRSLLTRGQITFTHCT